MPDTSKRPRSGPIVWMRDRPGPMFYDSWALCPLPDCLCAERDGSVWFNFALDRYRCASGHEFDHRTALWEVEAR